MSGAPPIRTCIGCGERDSKHCLARIVLDRNSKKIDLDSAGARPGRGAYLHWEAGCIERSLVQRRLARAFRGQVEVSAELASAAMRATGRVAM